MPFKDKDTPEMIDAAKFGKFMLLISSIFSLFLFFIIILYYRNNDQEWIVIFFIVCIWLAFTFIYGTILILKHKLFLFGPASVIFYGMMANIILGYSAYSKFDLSITLFMLICLILIFLIGYLMYKDLLEVSSKTKK